jgi:UDP-N-acetylglucosamine--N-acetylmuramyl-(pentapeptide) pyrophosphoryl-undecaprenol N-acetylglucosamine transferase
MTTSSLRVVLAGGGTGGHLYPGIALAQRLQMRCPDAAVSFLGLRGGLEERLVPPAGFALHTVPARALKGQSRLAQLQALGTLGVGTLQALRIVKRVRPHLLIGTGGYVMGPAVLAAALLRRPRVIMEQNVFPGLTVRALSRFAQVVFTAFPETARYLSGVRVEYAGTPVRQEICDIAAEPLPSPGRLHVLIFGGSQGAHHLNQAVLEALPLLARHRQQLGIVHQTGAADCAAVQQAYQGTGLQADVQPFLYDMAARYRWAHLVVCRAGASTLAELTVCGKPAILIPYPYAADDHQRLNAQAMQARGAAQVILDAELTGERLYTAIRELLLHPETLHAYAACSRQLGQPQAADTIITACLALLAASGRCVPHLVDRGDSGEGRTQHA